MFSAASEFSSPSEPLVRMSGVSTIFVGLGEDPGAMARLEPDLYQTIVKAYPEGS